MRDTFEAVWACSLALLSGAVVQAGGVTAGNGLVVDWREVRSGETVQDGGDPFDTAQLFVALVGAECALACVDGAPALHFEAPPVRITAFSANEYGARRRSFDAEPFRVIVEPHEDDAAQAAFTARLATLAAGARS